MTVLLYYSISSDLTKDEMIEIDSQVSNNRKFIKNLSSNSKRKAKRVLLYAMLISPLGQPLVPYLSAVMAPSPTQINIKHLVSTEISRSNNNNQCFVLHLLLNQKWIK